MKKGKRSSFIGKTLGAFLLIIGCNLAFEQSAIFPVLLTTILILTLRIKLKEKATKWYLIAPLYILTSYTAYLIWPSLQDKKASIAEEKISNLDSLVKSVFADFHMGKEPIKINHFNNAVEVQLYLRTGSLDGKPSKYDVESSLFQYMKGLHKLGAHKKYELIRVVYKVEGLDKFGNNSFSYAAYTAFPGKLIDKVNWDNFQQNMTLKLLETEGELKLEPFYFQ